MLEREARLRSSESASMFWDLAHQTSAPLMQSQPEQMASCLHTGEAVPPKGLADACMATYARLKAARFAVPALAALDRPRALSLLPKLVPLDSVAFKAAMHRLLLTQPGKGIPHGSTTPWPCEISVSVFSHFIMRGRLLQETPDSLLVPAK